MKRLLQLMIASFAIIAVQGCVNPQDEMQIDSSPLSANSGRRDAPEAPPPPPPATAIPGYSPSQTAGIIRLADKAYFYVPGKWSSNTIPVCWEAGTGPGIEREWVQDAVRKSWEAYSALHFSFTTVACSSNAVGIRIGVRDISVKDGPHTLGLGNELDKVVSGMVLNFTFRKWGVNCAFSESARERCIRSIAVHEFGHAIGFAHEQNRADTPGECAAKPQGGNGTLVLTPWDLHSVMNYCNPVYNNEGMLSKDDILMLVMQYGEKS